MTGQYTILAFLALDLHQSAGLSLVSASLLVVVANAMGIVGRIAWGAISDHALSRGRKPLLLLLNVTGLVAARRAARDAALGAGRRVRRCSRRSAASR